MTLGVLSVTRADVELDFDFAGQIILGSVKLLAELDTDSISNKFCLHCRQITVQSISINGASCTWYQRDLMTDVMLPQDAGYRDSVSYMARLREAVNRAVVGELEIFLPPSGIPRGGTSEIVIVYSKPLAASHGLAHAMGSDGRSYMLYTDGGTDMARCWVTVLSALPPPSSSHPLPPCRCRASMLFGCILNGTFRFPSPRATPPFAAATASSRAPTSRAAARGTL